MARFNSEDPKLAEVKAVLERLQNMSAERSFGEPGIDRSRPIQRRSEAEAASMRLASMPAPATSPPGEATAVGSESVQRPRASGRSRAIAMVLGACASTTILLVATRSIWLPEDYSGSSAKPVADRSAVLAKTEPQAPEPASATVQSSPQPAPVLAPATLKRADELIGAGQIAAGRAELLRITPVVSIDAAWALARSYDPNFVGSIADADAPPDVDEAAKWYRVWHGLAVKQGLVSDSVSIERIVGSMR